MDSKELRGLVEAYQQVNAPGQLDELSVNKMLAYGKAAQKDRDVLNKKWDEKKASHKEKMRVLGHEEGEDRAAEKIKKKTGKYPHQMNALDKARYAVTKEQLDIFDVVLEFLQAEGYAETLEEAEWMMANLIDEEAVAIILGEAEKPFPHEKVKAKQVALRDKGGNALDRRMKMGMAVRRAKEAEKTGGSQRDAGKGWYHAREEFELWVNELVEEGYDLSDYTWDEMYEFYLDEAIYSEKGKAKAAEMIAKRSTPSGRAKSGKGDNVALIRQIRGSGRGRFDREGLGGTPMTPTMAKNPIKKQNYDGTGNKAARRAGTYQEAFESWLDEAMSNYEKNRKRAAQRAAARNAARDQGKTGAVPGVGYVTPRRERETWTDESGKTRHAKGL